MSAAVDGQVDETKFTLRDAKDLEMPGGRSFAGGLDDRVEIVVSGYVKGDHVDTGATQVVRTLVIAVDDVIRVTRKKP